MPMNAAQITSMLNKTDATNRPPEMLQVGTQAHKFPITERCDIWNLGVILYKLMFMRSPFASTQEQLASIPVIPTGHPYHEGLIKLVLRTLHPDPLKRLSAHQLLLYFTSQYDSSPSSNFSPPIITNQPTQGSASGSAKSKGFSNEKVENAGRKQSYGVVQEFKIPSQEESKKERLIDNKNRVNLEKTPSKGLIIHANPDIKAKTNIDCYKAPPYPGADSLNSMGNMNVNVKTNTNMYKSPESRGVGVRSVPFEEEDEKEKRTKTRTTFSGIKEATSKLFNKTATKGWVIAVTENIDSAPKHKYLTKLINKAWEKTPKIIKFYQ